MVDEKYEIGYTNKVVNWPRGVAVNMSPCHGEDRRFKSDRGRHFFYLFLDALIYLHIFVSICLGSSVGRATD